MIKINHKLNLFKQPNFFATLRLNNSIVYLIPVLYFIWSIALQHIFGPFYLNRTDPTYPYLLNGLNCALLDFHKIGHVDHPGTTFQVLTGIFLWISFLLFGHGNLVEDVISRPEFYLSLSAFYLSVITFLILIWIGKITRKNDKSLLAVFIIQSTYIIFEVLFFFPFTYVPDRLLTITTLLLAALILKLIIQPGYSKNKFALLSGIVAGISMVTKINFIPLAIIPLFILMTLRSRFIYIASTGISAVIAFLPIKSKYVSFRNFITGLITHDGLYGGGNKQMINQELFTQHIVEILKSNPGLIILMAGVLTSIIILIFNPHRRKEHKTEFFYLISFLISAVLFLLIVAKHYKAYYVAPLLCLGSLTLFIIWRILREFIHMKILNSAVILLLFLAISGILIKNLSSIKTSSRINNNQLAISHFLKTERGNGYLFIEPTWLSGPLVENALVFGISYVADRYFFYNDYEKIYPDVFTWEGADMPVRFFRMLDGDMEFILKSGRDIFIYSTPGRNAPLLCDYIQKWADTYNIRVKRDTVVLNASRQEYLVRYSHTDDWNTKADISCGFENVISERMVAEKGNMMLSGIPHLTDKFVCNGLYAYKLDADHKKSPSLTLRNICQEDVIEVTLKIYHRNISGNMPGTLTLTGNYVDTDKNQMYTVDTLLSPVNKDWSMMRLKAKIDSQPADSTMKCFYIMGNEAENYIDDLHIKHYSRY